MKLLHFNEKKGSRDGYKLGRSDGYRLGNCEAIKRQVPVEVDIYRDVKVLFVVEAYENEKFHFPINQGIVASLQKKVREVVVARPDADITALAASIRPDLVLVLNGIFNFASGQVAAIRQLGIKTALWTVEDPYFFDVTKEVAPLYDFVFTHESSCIPYYQMLGCTQVHQLSAAVNEHLFQPKRVASAYKRDVCFIGTAFWNRVQLIDQVAPYLATKHILLSGLLWERLHHYKRLSRQIRLDRCLSPEVTANYYNGAKIVINLHRAYDDDNHNSNSSHIPAHSINPRTFEICACAALQLTDIRDDLTRFYTPGSEIATYSSPDELIAKIKYYLSHETEREKMALRGLNRTLREHTYPKRMEQLLSTVFGL